MSACCDISVMLLRVGNRTRGSPFSIEKFCRQKADKMEAVSRYRGTNIHIPEKGAKRNEKDREVTTTR